MMHSCKHNVPIFLHPLMSHQSQIWRCGVVVIATGQLHSTKPKLRVGIGSNPARGVLKIRDGEDL